MRRYLLVRVLFAMSWVFLVWQPVLPTYAEGPTGVLTRSNDNRRTGANLHEVVLNTFNVNVSQFGKLFSRSVDGHIYAQPLYVPDVTVPGKGIHNVVYVATQHDSVYAFDADDPAASAPLWHVSLGASVPISNVSHPGYMDIQTEVGVTGAPVIDPNTGTLYVVATTQDPDAIRHRLHALDIYTGAEKFGGPVVIAGSVSSAGGQGNHVVFDSQLQLQRPGLLLFNGVVYIAFGSYGDSGAYHGWIFGYDAATLQSLYIYNTTPSGAQGAIWQSGQGLATDDANIYAITANGTVNAGSGGADYSNSFIQLSPSAAFGGILPVADWFTPNDPALVDPNGDADLGSSGPMLIPGTDLVLGGSKAGKLFLVNRNTMGHYAGPNGVDQNVQTFDASDGSIFGSAVYWNSPNGPRVYVWGANDALKAYRLDGSHFQTTPVAVGSTALTGIGPGGILSLSANGSTPGTGIVWASQPVADANASTVPGILRAYDASNVAVELWNSQQNPGRDGVGNFAKFCPPTIADGKVFLATFSNELDVYGLFAPGILAQPSNAIVVSGEAITLSVRAVAPGPVSYQWYQGSSGDTSLPVGTNSPTFTTPPIASNTSFWARVSNGSGHADSRTADVIAASQVYHAFMPLITN